ncbi:MAG TPA: hypothetical protein VH228_17400 [Nocardioides sp.]|jgi:hypothetical protein|nr:hypothetical protein [Nocardioides sp.]
MTTSDETPEPTAHSPEEQTARLEELRKETAVIESELGIASTEPPPAGASGTRGGWWRPVVATVAIVLLAIIAPLAVVATWAHDEIADTNRYVATVAPLAHNPAVQDAVATRITDELLARLDVQGVTQEATKALSERGVSPRVAASLQALGTPLANAIENFIGDQVTKIVQSQAFADAWEVMNRAAHTQMVAVLTGENSDAVTVQGGAVQLNLGPVIDQVKARLASLGFALVSNIPPFNAQFTIFQSDDLAKAQTGFRVLSALAHGLPILALLLLAVGVLVAKRRRRTLVVASLVVAASMLVLGLLLNAFRVIYLDAIPADQLPPDAAAAIYDQVVSFVRLALRGVLVLFLAVAVVSWVSGPEPRPVAVRRATTRALDTVRHRRDSAGLNTGPVGEFLGRYRGGIRWTVLGAVVLLYVLADHPTGAFTLKLLIVAAVVLLIVELLAMPPAHDEPGDDSAVPSDQTAADSEPENVGPPVGG